MNNQVIQFEHIQSLSLCGDGPRWSERVEARVTLTDRALSSGWLREHFTGRKGGTTDFVVLLVITMHARPLKGDDLQYLIALEMASDEDEGRLYARITDKGLANELGIYRETIAASTQRLAKAGFMTIVETRGQPFRDSHGQFKGSKIYLISGELEQFLPKTLVSSDIHRAASDRTDELDRAALYRTVHPENVSTVRPQTAYRAALSGTNIKRIEDEEGEEGFLEKIAEHEIFSRFAQLLGRAYTQSVKDRQALTSLAAEGYSTADILAAIERTTEHLGGSLHSVRSFAYLIPEVRRFRPAAAGGDSVSRVDSDSTAGDSAPPAGSAPAHFEQTEPATLPEEVERAFRAVMRQSPTLVERQRLVWLHESLGAKSDAEKAWADILAAIKFQLNPEARNPVAYLHKLLLSDAAKKPRPKPKTRKDKLPDRGQVAASSSTLTVVGEAHPPIQLADGMILTRPPERPSGFVDPSEAVQRNLYDSIKAVRELDCRLNLSNPGGKNGKS